VTLDENTNRRNKVEKNFPQPTKKAVVIEKVYALGDSLCEAEGMELIYVEYQSEAGGRILRLYIDKPGGVTLDDCAVVSRQMSDILDVGFDDLGPYRLEISSPGLERPLGRKKDFEKYRGHRIKVKTVSKIANKKNHTGIIGDVTDDSITLVKEDGAVVIPFLEISKARLLNKNGENRC
jgi:ribosome maturation factor RimP